MKNILILFTLLGLVAASSCKKDDETTYGTLTINVKAVYDNEPLQTFTTFPFNNGQQIQFSLMSLMLSDINLYAQSNTIQISDIQLADMSFDNLAAAEKGYTIKSMNIPTGSYSGIQFGIGVPSDLNAMTPADFPSASPLSKSTYYWIPWSSYIFSKTEGKLDTAGTGTLDLAFALHTGSDELYRGGYDAAIPIVIEDQKDTQLDIVIDYKALLAGVDIQSNPLNHNPQDIVTITAMVNNYVSAITLRH